MRLIHLKGTLKNNNHLAFHFPIFEFLFCCGNMTFIGNSYLELIADDQGQQHQVSRNINLIMPWAFSLNLVG